MDSNEEPKQKVVLSITKTMAFEVTNRDTIEDIKAMVFTTEGVAMDQQELSFDGNVLDGSKSLAYFNIASNSTIDIKIGAKVLLFVRIPPSGKTIMLEVWNCDTVQRLKDMIMDKAGIPQNQQKLIYLGRPLRESHKLIAYDIREGSTIFVVLNAVDEVNISVSMMCGKIISLEVRTWYSIGHVKMLIESIEEVPANLQKLVYDGKQLEDCRTLNDYNIKDKSFLEMKIYDYPMQIFVRSWSRVTVTLIVKNNFTINKVIDKFQKKTDIVFKCKDQLRLSFNGRILQKDRTLQYYHVQSGSTMHLQVCVVGKHYQILLNVENKRTVALDKISQYFRVSYVKFLIEKRHNISCSKLKLSYLGKELHDDCSLDIYDVPSGSTLLLDS